MRCHGHQRAAARGSSSAAAHGARAVRAAPPGRGHQKQHRGAGLVTRVSTGDGVQDLLARDRKKQQQEPAASEFDLPAAPAADAPPASDPPPAGEPEQDAGGRRGRGGGRLKSRAQRRRDMAANEDLAAGRGPRRCKEAIDQGLELFQQRQYQAAIDSFNLALELPGNGAYRLSGSPREFLCPSDAEEHAALYNMACCYAQMGQADAALTCLEAILETGFEGVDTMMSDPDLAPVRGPQLQQLISKYRGLPARLLGVFKKKEQVITSDPNQNRPWWEVRW